MCLIRTILGSMVVIIAVAAVAIVVVTGFVLLAPAVILAFVLATIIGSIL